MKKSNILSKVLTVVMIIECLLIIVTFGLFWTEFTFDYSWYESEENLLYDIQEERYGQLMCDYYTNVLGGYKQKGDVSECYGVAKYFEAALWYNAYEKAGDGVRSAIYAEKMSSAYEEMGDYQFLEEKIKVKLNMQ